MLTSSKASGAKENTYGIVIEEVQKLIDVDFIWESYYPKWILNVVLVKKPNRT